MKTQTSNTNLTTEATEVLNINTLLSELIEATTEATEATEAKKAKASELFHACMNSVITTYISNKATSNDNYKTSVNNLLTEATEKAEASEKTSVIKLVDIIRYNLLNIQIKHEIISFSNAKALFTNIDLIVNSELASIKASATEEKAYNKMIKAYITNKVAEAEEKFMIANRAIVKSINKQDVENLEIIIKASKILLARKKAEAKASEKAEKAEKLASVKAEKLATIKAEKVAKIEKALAEAKKA